MAISGDVLKACVTPHWHRCGLQSPQCFHDFASRPRSRTKVEREELSASTIAEAATHDDEGLPGEAEFTLARPVTPNQTPKRFARLVEGLVVQLHERRFADSTRRVENEPSKNPPVILQLDSPDTPARICFDDTRGLHVDREARDPFQTPRRTADRQTVGNLARQGPTASASANGRISTCLTRACFQPIWLRARGVVATGLGKTKVVDA